MTRINTARRLSRWVGWIVLLFVAFATLSSIELRPHVAGANKERFVAFAAIGFLFSFGYPRRVTPLLFLAVASAVLLEWGQTFAFGRHARAFDALVKICGAVGGIGFAWCANSALAAFRADGPALGSERLR